MSKTFLLFFIVCCVRKMKKYHSQTPFDCQNIELLDTLLEFAVATVNWVNL